jgi:hypothetical protein
VRAVAAIGFTAACAVATAGSIGFSVSFTGDDVSITNAGTEAAYRVSLWTLDPTSKWHKVQILSGNTDYLSPGQTLKWRRQTVAASTGLGRGDPLLLELYDQAGGRVTQLAWRVSPAVSKNPLPIQRKDGNVLVPVVNSAFVSTYGIVVPYEGIAKLTHGFADDVRPPDPQRHSWVAGAPMVLQTGAGKGGAWLVHETAAGAIEMQIVADGVDRGREQVPSWLVWVRNNLMRSAVVLAGLGALLLVLGGLGSRRRARRLRAEA